MRNWTWSCWLLLGLLAGSAAVMADVPPVVSLVTDAAPGRAARHGLEQMTAALRAQGLNVQTVPSVPASMAGPLIVTGVAGSGGAVDEVLKAAGYAPPTGNEGLLVKSATYHGRPTWILAGADDRGLMYAELDAAERIGWSRPPEAPLAGLREASESAAVNTRAVSVFTMNRAYWESRFYDEAYWTRYLDTLARDRFNSFVVIFGYENGGFLAPCYPYFFDTPGFPGVRMVGLSAAEQARNLRALNRLIELAHDRGIAVTLGIWDHIYRGGVQGGGVPGANDAALHPTPSLVWGVNAENLVAYTQAALGKFVREVPHLDAIQFRMHDESGIKPSEQEGFWRDVFQQMRAQAPALRLDLRAKGLPDSVIQAARDTGINFRITTKYWEEQMGLPFHPTHVNPKDQKNRRHSYADLLRYPRQYSIHWRMFSGGTMRILLWGDPEYARRFADSTHLYDGEGFEINEPLATKMEGQPHDEPPFALLKPSARYTDYEFERYWYYFQVFGRLGYNPATSPEIWRRQFEQRFGAAAAPEVEAALEAASGILPRIVAASSPYSGFPMTEGWAEKQHFGALAGYSAGAFSDPGQFESFDEEAQRLIARGETARTRPQDTSQWFARRAADVSAHVAAAERSVGGARSKEFDSTVVDLKILAKLALYHARRIPAAVSYRLFVRTKDSQALDDAIGFERQAAETWRQLVAAAGDQYAADLKMGARSRDLCGDWRTELANVQADLRALELQRQGLPATAAALEPPPRYLPAETAFERPAISHQAVTSAAVNQPLRLTLEAHAPAGIKWVRVRYRSVNQYDDYRVLPMTQTGSSGQYEATIPAEHVPGDHDFMYYFEIMDGQGRGCLYPDFEQRTPYVVVPLIRR